ncbi:MAG: copper resistance protein CopD [Caulobacter sp. 35-67-4]|nr:MAG: copper resistance protein CopD [Caulobacter sp. 32-67-35]OYX99968.1 MAG: copper resistance protein CopD [Caulobacter sp. 35-67-4]HQR90191.1 copper homeostasis membrane protein CopD [Caulobacter sp.]
MLEPAVIILRLAQYTGAMILFGSSLFALYALAPSGMAASASLRWLRPLLAWSAAGLLAASLLGLLAQTSVLAGSLSEGLKLSSLSAVVTTMGFGRSALVRAVGAGLALFLLLPRRLDRTSLRVCAMLGAVTCASFAWMGHGAATEGPGGSLHLGADILHSLAAGVWIGALVGFLFLLKRRSSDDAALDHVRHRALHGFSGIGSVLVATLVASGLVNSWFLIGPTRIPGLWTTPYGQLLSLKLLLFAGMLVLAAANRFHLTPTLRVALDTAAAREPALGALRRSLVIESALAIAVLGLVAGFGMLAPVSAQ